VSFFVVSPEARRRSLYFRERDRGGGASLSL